MILLLRKWASFLMFLTIVNTSASSILNSKLQLGPKEVEFAVLAENPEAVMEFCQGGGCTYAGQVNYMEGICKQFTKMKLQENHLKKKTLCLKNCIQNIEYGNPVKTNTDQDSFARKLVN